MIGRRGGKHNSVCQTRWVHSLTELSFFLNRQKDLNSRVALFFGKKNCKTGNACPARRGALGSKQSRWRPCPCPWDFSNQKGIYIYYTNFILHSDTIQECTRIITQCNCSSHQYLKTSAVDIRHQQHDLQENLARLFSFLYGYDSENLPETRLHGGFVTKLLVPASSLIRQNRPAAAPATPHCRGKNMGHEECSGNCLSVDVWRVPQSVYPIYMNYGWQDIMY